MDAAALYAGSVLLKKTFEALAQRSVTSLFSRLHCRFRGEHQIEILQKELESRLQVLSLPVDMCVQYVLRGNTVLQGALDMVVRVINDIVRFQEELEAQVYNEDIIKTSPSEAEARLKGFLTRLDAILPYMAIAMNAVSLLKSENSGVSPARLMEASYLVRNAGTRNAVVTIPMKVYEYETRLVLPHWQEKIPTCTLMLKNVVNDLNASSQFVIQIETEEEDNESEWASHLSIPLSTIVSVGSSTLHVLGLGEHELEAVLLMDVCSSSTNAIRSPGTPAQEPSSRIAHYAFQCMDVDEEDSENVQTSANEDDVGARTARLGVLEYVLRLCMLQIREEKDHWLVPDERIKMFFSDPRFHSEPMKNVSKPERANSNELTPVPKSSRTPQKQLTLFSRTPTTRKTSVTDLFYELHLGNN